MARPRTIGIDLGTACARVGVCLSGLPRLLPVEGDLVIPAVVGIDSEGALLVGREAVRQLLIQPDRTVQGIKRSMGRGMSFPLGNHLFSPLELSALILRRLKRGAEEALGHAVDRAVITVPAYFSKSQEAATREAGEAAGFHVVRTVSEPAAAMLCYSGRKGASDCLSLVFDLGATLDVSIIRVEDGVAEVVASEGNPTVGGQHFDQALVGLLRERFEEEAGINLQGRPVALARLQRAAQQAKVRLSTQAWAVVREEYLAGGAHLQGQLCRSQYESCIAGLVERSVGFAEQALDDAGIRVEEVDEVILVGGSTHTPLIQAELCRRLRRPLRREVEPEHAVCLGAALFAARLDGDRRFTIVLQRAGALAGRHVRPLRPTPSQWSQVRAIPELDRPGRLAWMTAVSLVERAYQLSATVRGDERQELEQTAAQLEAALRLQDLDELSDLSGELADLLFFLERS